MDSNKHNDWTGAVRERLEGRELTPSDALWERIGAAVAQAAAPRKVRRLAWGGAIGAAAAAALAAVLFLRPAGTKEDGRVEVVPTGAAPLAEQRVLADTESPVTPVEESPVTMAEMSLTRQRVASDTKSPVTAAEEAPVIMAELPASTETVVATDAKQAVDASRQQTAAVSQKTGSEALNVAKVSEKTGRSIEPEDTAMSLEDFLAQEEKEKRPRRLTASIYAAGRPSAGIIINNDFLEDLISFDIGNSDNTPSSPAQTSVISSDASSSIPPYGYYTDPENTTQDKYLSYANDPYNLSGERLNHSKPVSIGIAVSYPLHNQLFLESGMYYSYLRSSSYRKDQTIHSIGIPLKVGYRFGSARRTSLALSAGAKAEKCLLALKGGEKVKEPGIQLAAVGSAAIQYNFSPRLGLFIAPELSYWFTETKLPTYNTEHPFNLSLKAGLSLSLGD